MKKVTKHGSPKSNTNLSLIMGGVNKINKTSKHNPKQVLMPNLNQSAENFTFEEVARDYDMEPERLLEFFRTEGIFDENNRPYPYYVEQGYFKVVEVPILPVPSVTITTPLSQFSEVIEMLSPDDLQSYFRAIDLSTPIILRKSLMKRVVENLLITARNEAEESINLMSATSKGLKELNTFLDWEIEQGKKDSYEKQQITEIVQKIEEQYSLANRALGLIGELIFHLLDLFETVASDQDYATLLGVSVQDIIDARAWFNVNITDGDGEYKPSFGEITGTYPLEMGADGKTRQQGPFLRALVEAEYNDLLGHSKYVDVINILKEMVME
ncbi:MAG: phage antirepressor KilAC domain-containing protein [Desulfosporosinus sp.]|nr:phage antirepressor KilAC domain-containing protein [Desulfosporosinus sp.]